MNQHSHQNPPKEREDRDLEQAQPEHEKSGSEPPSKLVQYQTRTPLLEAGVLTSSGEMGRS